MSVCDICAELREGSFVMTLIVPPMADDPNSAEPPPEKPPIRIGRAYRRHPDLVEMFSDQKILLDAFDVLPDNGKKNLVDELLREAAESRPTAYTALSPVENQLMGRFLQLDAEGRKRLLERMLEMATAEVRERRKQLF